MCQMASISGKWEVAVREYEVRKKWKGFQLDSVVVEVTRDPNRLLGRQASGILSSEPVS